MQNTGTRSLFVIITIFDRRNYLLLYVQHFLPGWMAKILQGNHFRVMQHLLRLFSWQLPSSGRLVLK